MSKGVSGASSGTQGEPKGGPRGSRGIQGATWEVSENVSKNGGGRRCAEGSVLASAAVTLDPVEG